MSKIILLDVDGLVIKKRPKYFSTRLIEEFNVSREEANRFVHELLFPAQEGKLDLKDEFAQYLQKWGITQPVDEMLHIWWQDEQEIDKQVLGLVDKMREKGFKVGLATDQEKYRAQHLLQALGLAGHFDHVFISFELGFKKDHPQFWTQVLSSLQDVKPEEIIYFDDDQKNIDAANSHGVQGSLYVNSDPIKSLLDQT